jgi:hypothetical protein
MAYRSNKLPRPEAVSPEPVEGRLSALSHSVKRPSTGLGLRYFIMSER